jgi:hypothetical protein
MSENIENDAVVEETTPVEEPIVETPVAEEAPVVEPEPEVEAPKVVASADSGSLEDKKNGMLVYSSRDLTLKKLNKTLPAGFSTIPFEEARIWLALGSVRPATPEEATKELGK